MAIKWISYFLDETNLEDSELLLAVVLADHSDNDGVSYPGVTTIAKRLRKQVRQTQVLLGRLQSKGYLKIDRGTGRGHLNKYRLQRVHCNTSFEPIKGAAENTVPEPERVHSEVEKGCILEQERVHFGVSHIKEGNIRETEEETKDAREPLPDFGYPLSELYSAFPNLQITPAQAGLIEAAVTEGDREAWKRTIEQYVANHNPMLNRYLPEKVGNLINVFKSKQGEVQRQNGITQANSGQQRPSAGRTIANRWYRQTDPGGEANSDG
jgi:hypothetical protein